MPLYLWLIIWGAVASALLGTAYLGLGGRAIFGTRERPDRVIGRRAQLSQQEGGPTGLDPRPPPVPPATVASYSPQQGYLLRFDAAVEWAGRSETQAWVSARHAGYPVSLAAGWLPRGIWVNGEFGSGERFTSAFRLVHDPEASSSNGALQPPGLGKHGDGSARG